MLLCKLQSTTVCVVRFALRIRRLLLEKVSVAIIHGAHVWMDQQCSFTTLGVHENTGRTSEKDWRQIPRVSECWVKPLFIRNNARYSGYLKCKKHTNDLVPASNERQKFGFALCVHTSCIVSKVEPPGKKDGCSLSLCYIDDNTQDRQSERTLAPQPRHAEFAAYSAKHKNKIRCQLLSEVLPLLVIKGAGHKGLITHLSIGGKHHLIPHWASFLFRIIDVRVWSCSAGWKQQPW